MTSSDARRTVRHSGYLLAQRALYIGGGFLWALCVPRLLGPSAYGQYALLTSLAIWFARIGSLGTAQVLGRYLPEFELRAGRAGAQAFFGQLLRVRAGAALASAGLFLLVMHFWLRRTGLPVLAAIAGTVLLRGAGDHIYALNLGLNRAGRWALADLLRRWLSLVLLPVGFMWAGLPGACLSLLLTELLILAVGAHWSDGYLAGLRARPDLRSMRPYLLFGLTYYGGDLLLSAFNHSGEALVRAAAGDYAQVSYFALALDMYLAVALAIPQFTAGYMPLLSRLRIRGQEGALRAWGERLLKWVSIGAVLLVYGVLFLARHLVPLLLGPDYRAVAPNLILLSFSLPALALSGVAGVIALTYERPQFTLQAAALRLAVLWGAGVPLVRLLGSRGASLALAAGAFLYAGYLTRRVRPLAGYSLRGWVLAAGLSVPPAALLLLCSTPAVDALLYLAFIAGYGCLLFLLRVVTPQELAAAWRALRLRGPAKESPGL